MSEHVPLEGHKVAFLHSLPDGTRYFLCVEYATDSGATSYTRGVGPSDRAAKNVPVIVDE